MTKNNTNPQKWLTTAGLAERLRISPSAVQHQKAGTDTLTRYRVGRLLRFSIKEVEDFERDMGRKRWRK